jgi:hypothetical protein
VYGDTAPRFTQEELPQGIIRSEGKHPLKNTFPGRRENTAHDDITDFAASVTADHCDHVIRPHLPTIPIAVFALISRCLCTVRAQMPTGSLWLAPFW